MDSTSPGTIVDHFFNNTSSWVSTSSVPTGVTADLNSGITSLGTLNDYNYSLSFYASKYGNQVSGLTSKELFALPLGTDPATLPSAVFKTNVFVIKDTPGTQVRIDGGSLSQDFEVITNEVLPDNVVGYHDLTVTLRPVLNPQNGRLMYTSYSASNAQPLLGPFQSMPDPVAAQALETGAATTGTGQLLEVFGADSVGQMTLFKNLGLSLLPEAGIAPPVLALAAIDFAFGSTPAGEDPLTLYSQTGNGPSLVAKANAYYQAYLSAGGQKLTYGDVLREFLCNAGPCTGTLDEELQQITNQELVNRYGNEIQQFLAGNATVFTVTDGMAVGYPSGMELYIAKQINNGVPIDSDEVNAQLSAIQAGSDPWAQQAITGAGYTGDPTSPLGTYIGYQILNFALDESQFGSPSNQSTDAALPLVQGSNFVANTSAEIHITLNNSTSAASNIADTQLSLLQGSTDVSEPVDAATSNLNDATSGLSDLNSLLQSNSNLSSSPVFSAPYQSTSDAISSINDAVQQESATVSDLAALVAVRDAMPEQYVEPGSSSLGASTEGTTNTLSPAQSAAFLSAASASHLPVSQASDTSGSKYAFITLPFEMGGFTVRVPIQ